MSEDQKREIFRRDFNYVKTLVATIQYVKLKSHRKKEKIKTLELERTKFNFPEGMPIEDQSDDDDGYWM